MMDPQGEPSLETMSAGLPSTSAAVASVSHATASQKGFPKNIAQSNVEEKFLCEHCKLILRNPLQSLCGHRFCRTCRDHLLSYPQPVLCQACISEGVSEEESQLDLTSMFDDKAAIREMKKIPVKCVNNGCTWKGMFSDYTTTHESSCDKKLVECSLCNVPVSQARISHHETKQCPKRTVACQHCKETMSADQLEKHCQTACPNVPLKCDMCSKLLPRKELKSHRDEECPHRIIECPVPDCNTKLPMDQFPNHFIKSPQSTQRHMLYLFSKTEQLSKIVTQMETEAAAAVGGAAGGVAELSRHVGRDESAAGAEAHSMASEDKQKLKLHEDLMAVLHGEILRCIRQVEALNGRLEREGRNVKDVHKKIDNLERSLGALEGRLLELSNRQTDLESRRVGPAHLLDPKEYGMIKELPDGTVAWRIDRFTSVRRAACSKTQLFISSPIFSTGPYGYNMKIRFFADGDGQAKGRAISAFIQLVSGPFDDLLPWPFTGKIYFMLVDQKDFREHKVVSFSALSDQPAFDRPRAQSENVASGCLEFVNLKDFNESPDKYLPGDSLFMQVYISVPESVTSRLQSLDLKTLIGVRR